MNSKEKNERTIEELLAESQIRVQKACAERDAHFRTIVEHTLKPRKMKQLRARRLIVKQTPHM